MLTLQKARQTAIASVQTDNKDVETLLSKEWLLTNNCGGYASSTIIGCNTRRYHGLLIGSLTPPANRIMALANCLEMVICNGQVFNLSTIEFNGKFAPEGFSSIKRFRRDTGAHFDYELDMPPCRLKLTKSVYLLRDKDTVVLSYDFTTVKQPIEFILRPFVGLRDFHSLQKSYAPLCSKQLDSGLLIRHDIPESCDLFISCPSMNFDKDQQWWFNFVYRTDRERGQEFTEDLWTPGFFKCRIDSPTKIVFWANLSSHYKPQQHPNVDIENVRKDLQQCQDNLIADAKVTDKRFEKLCLAADQFIVNCQSSNCRTTVLAGFPWFMDWGRDAFISLPGLLLSTGRFDEAKSVLTTFAQVADEGMIPNRFDDRSDTAYFNSIDASVWFINAAFQYLNATGDSETFSQKLLPMIRWIIHSYHNGTRFGIHADTDGLITAGNEGTQLTWMDAKYEGVAFTPRHGKVVEVNALWYNSLCWLAEFYTGRDPEAAVHYRTMASKVEFGFQQLFWNEQCGYLNDCILENGSADSSLRPNQIFAVSLPFSPLSAQHQKSVVDIIHKELLTPYGLRTLAARDSRYRGIYTGPQKQRDEAYHQGTIWPFLIGPFIESYLKVNNFSRKSKDDAAKFIEPLMHHFTEDGCIGSISEIFDGDPPHKPRGCFAQAWSVAELIRAYLLINS